MRLEQTRRRRPPVSIVKLLLQHGWKLGFALVFLLLITSRSAAVAHPMPRNLAGTVLPTNVPCGTIALDPSSNNTATWTATSSPYGTGSPYNLPWNDPNLPPNDPTVPNCLKVDPNTGQLVIDPTTGKPEPDDLRIAPGTKLIVDGRDGPVKIFSHGAGIVVAGGEIDVLGSVTTDQTTGKVTQDNSVQFDAEPDAASWDGIRITTGLDPKTNLTDRGQGSFTYASIQHALTSISIDSGSTGLTDPNTGNQYGLMVSNFGIGPSYFDGIDAVNTPVQLTGLGDGRFGTVNNIGSQGVKVTFDRSKPNYPITPFQRSLDLERVVFGSSVPFADTTCVPLQPCSAGSIGNDGIQGNFAASAPSIMLDSNRFYRAGSYGVELSGTNDPTLTNNSFICNGSGSPTPVASCVGNGLKFSAIYLNDATVDLQNRVTNNTGREDGLDAIVFNGTVTSPTFTWRNATNDLLPHPLGYLINGTMAMNGGTFRVPGGSFVKVKDGALDLNGVTLDASDAGAKIFTSLRDNAGIQSCPSVFVQNCPAVLPAGEWGGINLLGGAANGTVNDAAIEYATTGIQINNGATTSQSAAIQDPVADGANFGLVVQNSLIGPTFADGISALDTPVSVVGTTFACPIAACATAPPIGNHGVVADFTAAGRLNGGLKVAGSSFVGTGNEGILGLALSGQMVNGLPVGPQAISVTNNAITNAGAYGVRLDRAVDPTITGNSVSGSGTGSPSYPAIFLPGLDQADFNAAIADNTGSGNGLNAIAFDGKTRLALIWKTIGASNDLGYLLDGNLTVNGNLILNAGSYAPVLGGSITVKSGLLSADQSTITSLKEQTPQVPSCGSVFVPRQSGRCPAVAAGDWGGLVLASGQPNVLTNSEIRDATTGITVASPSTDAVSLTLASTNIRTSTGDGISSTSSLTVDQGAFTNLGGHGVVVDLSDGGAAGLVTIDQAAISHTGAEGLMATAGNAGQRITVTNTTIDHPGSFGLRLVTVTNPTVKSNHITNAPAGTPAIYLPAVDKADFNNAITGNLGASNGDDAIAFDGNVTGPLIWLTARNSSDPSKPLGYLLDGDLNMTASTFTLAAGDIVKISNGQIKLTGGRLDASSTSTSSQKVFTSLQDQTVGVPCPSALQIACSAPAAAQWNRVYLTAGADGAFVNAAIRYATTGISIDSKASSTVGSSSYGLVVSRSSITAVSGDAITTNATSTSITDSTINNAGSHGINADMTGAPASSALRFSGNRIMSTGAEAILGLALSGQPVWITDNHVQNAGTFGLRLANANELVLRNNNVADSGTGATAYSAIELSSVTGDFQNNIRGNVGQGNGINAIGIDGKIQGNLTWITPPNRSVASTKPLGYLFDGGVTLDGGNLTVSGNDVVKALGGPITLSGGKLIASDTSALKIFTSIKDPSGPFASCPSFFGQCIPEPGDWGGLSLTDNANGQKASGSIANALINYANTGISVDSGTSATSDPNLSVSGTTILNTSKDGINAFDSPIDVESSYIGDPSAVTVAAPPLTNIGAHGIIASFFSPANCPASPPAPACVRLKLIGNSLLGMAKDGIVANGLGGEPVDIETNTVANAGTYGIRLVDANQLTLRDNTVNASGGATTAFRYPAIYLSSVTADFEVPSAPGTVAGNHGSGNGIDAIALHGKATNPLIWLTTGVLYAGTSVDHFGYVLDGDLAIAGGLKTNTGDTVKVLAGAINVGTLDATGTTFTSLKDDTVGAVACVGGAGGYDSVFIQRSASACPAASSGDWKGINVTGAATITASKITFDDGLTVKNGSLDFEGGTMHDIAANAISLTSSPSTVRGVNFYNVGGQAIVTTGAAVSVQCAQVLSGGISGDSSLSVGQSDLLAFYNPTSSVPDITETSGTVVAQDDFWGPPDPSAPNPTPPTIGQTTGSVDSTHPLATQRPTLDSTVDPKVSLTIVDGPLDPNQPLGSPAQPLDPNQVDLSNNPKSDGTGLLKVTAVYGREMDTTLDPTIAFSFSVQPVRVTVPGDGWQADKQTFIVYYRLDSSVGAIGPTAASVTLSAARACVKADIMTPKTVNFNVDLTSFATAQISLPGDAPTRVGAHSALLHGGITSNGYAITDGSTVQAHFVVTPQGGGSSILVPIRENVPKNAPANYPVSGLASGLSPGTDYFYSLVVSSPNNVAVGGVDSGLAATDLVTTDDVKAFIFDSIASPQTAGNPFLATITAVDDNAQTVEDYTGTATLSVLVADTLATLPSDPFTTGDTADNGVHTFQSVTLTKAVVQTLAANGTGALLPSGSSAAFTVKPGALDHFTVASIADQTAASPFTVQATAKDLFENIKVDYAGGASVTGSTGAAPGSSTAGCTGPCSPNYGAFGTWTGGVATANVTLYKAEPARSLTVADGTHTGTSNTFTVAASTVDQIAFSQEPAGPATGGSPFTTQPSVLARDVYGNGVQSTSVALTITSGTGTPGASLSCPIEASNTLNTDSSGVAAFTDCAIDKTGTNYKLHAAAAGKQADSSPAFDITVGAPHTVSFTQEPAGPATGGSAFTTQPQVTVTDAGGNLVSGSNVVLSITSGTGAIGATLTCDQASNTEATDSNGLAAFTGCKIDKASTAYTLHAVAQTASGDSSPAFEVTVGPAAGLIFHAEPAGAAPNTAFTTQPEVWEVDAGGNAIGTDSATQITLGITSGTGAVGANLTCDTNPVTVAGGKALFSGCKIDLASPPDYQLHADGGGFNTDSSSFKVQ